MLAESVHYAIRVERLVVRHHILKVYLFVTLGKQRWRCVAAVVLQLGVVNLGGLTLVLSVVSILLCIVWRRF